MNQLTKKEKSGIFAGAFGATALVLGGIVLYKRLAIRMPVKEYTAACLYIAVMDDEISRNELEGNSVGGKKIVFPPKIESLQNRYNLFLQLNKKLTAKQMETEIKKFEIRLEESKQYAGQPKEDLTIDLSC